MTAPDENRPIEPATNPSDSPKTTGGFVAWLRAIGTFRGFLLVSLIPVSVGTALAHHENGPLNYFWLTLTMLAVWFFHAGANLLNDYYDHVSGTDDINEVITPFSGGTRVIQDALLSANAIRNAGIFAYLVGGALFGYVGWYRGPFVWVLAGLGAAAGIFYTMKPIWLAYRGWGELILGLSFGPFLTAMGAFVQMGRVPVSAWVIGTALGLWSAAIVTINEVPDIDADEEVGKRNLVVRFGAELGIRLWALLLWLSPALLFAAMLPGVVDRRFAPVFLIVFPIFFLTRRPEDRLDHLEDVVVACRNTILSYVGFWLLLIGSIFFAHRAF